MNILAMLGENLYGVIGEIHWLVSVSPTVFASGSPDINQRFRGKGNISRILDERLGIPAHF